MKQSWVKGFAALLLATATIAVAAEQDENGGWSLRLGASYREFYDVKFSPVNFANWGNATVAGVPYGVQDLTNLNVAFATPVPVDYVRWNGGIVGLGTRDGWAPVIGLSKELVNRCPFQLGFVSNLQYYSLDKGLTDDGTMAAPGKAFTAYEYTQVAINVPNQMVLPGFNPNAVPTAGTDTRFWLRNRFSADLFVLDAGLEAKVEPVKCLNLVLAAGPSLNLADVDSLQDYFASWTQPAGVAAYPAGPYHRKRSQRDFDAVAGLYGAVGLQVALNEKWSLAALYRYDYVPEGIGTDQAEVSLTGRSGQVMLIYAF